MHGGAKGSGAPKGNQNALKHGLYTAEAIQHQKHITQFFRDVKATIEKIK
jgi:uncharacterized protein YjcR